MENVVGLLGQLGIYKGKDKTVTIKQLMEFLWNGSIENEYRIVGGRIESAIGSIKVPSVGDFYLTSYYSNFKNANELIFRSNNHMNFELKIDEWKIKSYTGTNEYNPYASIHLSNDGWIDIFIYTEVNQREIKNEVEFKLADERDKKDLINREKLQMHIIFAPKCQ